MKGKNKLKPTDYNDYADLWIELKAQVNLMHGYSLQQNWGMAKQCAERCSELSKKLSEFYGAVA